MKAEHANELLKNYPLGIKILFSNNIEKWQKTQSVCSTTTLLPILNKKTHEEKSFEAIGLNLGQILNASSTGLMIQEYYKTNHKFNDSIRTLLVDTIISYIITKQISMSVNIANIIADQIVYTFPTEVKVCTFFNLIYNFTYSV